MKLNYSLTNEDFLTYQLYKASQSDALKRKRLRSRYIIPALYVLFALFLSSQSDNNMAFIGFIVFAAVWLLFYPMYSKWLYERQFKKHIEEHYKNRVNQPITLEFVPDGLDTMEGTTTSRIVAKEINSLIELPEHFLIELESGVAFIVPKHAIDNSEEFKQKASEMNASYVDATDWVWK